MSASAKNQVKTFVKLASEYFAKKTEKNREQLQRHLQILSVISDLSAFEPTNLEVLEFYKCLSLLLRDTDPKSSLPWKVINLVLHIIGRNAVRISFRDDLLLVSLLSQYIYVPNLSRDQLLKLLNVLQSLSYGMVITRKEAWLIKFIPALASVVLQHKDADDVIEFSVATLANLCRGNSQVIQLLMDYVDRKPLVRVLIDLRSACRKTQLMVSEILIYIDFNHRKVDMNWFEDNLDHISSEAVNGLKEGDCRLLELSKDIFSQIIKRTDLQEPIRRYKKFRSSIDALLENVDRSNCQLCVGHLFEFLSMILNLEHKDVLGCVDDILPRVMQWLHDCKVGSGSSSLLHSIICLSDHSISGSRMDDILKSVKESLVLDQGFELSSENLDWLSSLLRLVQSFAAHDTVFNYRLSKALEPPFMSSVLSSFMESKDESSKTPIYLISSSICSTNIVAESMPLFNSISRNGDCNVLSQPRGGDCIMSVKRRTMAEKCSEIVARIVFISKSFRTQNPEFKVEYLEMLNNSTVIEHIVCCERSVDSSLVNLASEILCDEVPKESFGALVKAQTAANTVRETESVLSSQDERSSVCSPISASQLELVNSTIEKLRTSCDATEFKDVPLSSVMDFYEYKICSMEHDEKQLQDSLNAADQIIRNMKIRVSQSNLESSRLRSLLRAGEERFGNSQKQELELRNQIGALQNTARQQREDLLKEKRGVERQLEKTGSDLSSAHQSLKSKEEELKRLQKNVADANAECKALQKRIKQEQKDKSDLRDVISKMEEDKKQHKKGFEDLEKENARLEKLNGGLKKEKTELEMSIKGHEQTLAEKEALIEEMKSENQGLRKIRDMIHNISAGKMC